MFLRCIEKLCKIQYEDENFLSCLSWFLFFFFLGGGGAEKVRLFVEGFIAYVCRVRTDWIPGRIPLHTCDMSFPPRGPCTDIDPSSGCTLCSYSHSCCSHKPHIYSYNLLLKYGYCLKYRVLLSFFFNFQIFRHFRFKLKNYFVYPVNFANPDFLRWFWRQFPFISKIFSCRMYLEYVRKNICAAKIFEERSFNEERMYNFLKEGFQKWFFLSRRNWFSELSEITIKIYFDKIFCTAAQI